MAYNKIVISCIVIIVMFTVVGCSQKNVNDSDGFPKDFNFSLVYGTYGKQKIDTFNGVVVKDLVEDGTIKENITFTEEEMKDIYKKMMEINIMGELDLTDKFECDSDPPSLSIWNIQMNGKTKTIEYGDFCVYPQDVSNLLKLEGFIIEILTSKKEYKELPEPTGGYD